MDAELVERVARIISGAPFPSERSRKKARVVVAEALEWAQGQVLDLRAKNAANFDRAGLEWKGYDQATLDAVAAIRRGKEPT